MKVNKNNKKSKVKTKKLTVKDLKKLKGGYISLRRKSSGGYGYVRGYF